MEIQENTTHLEEKNNQTKQSCSTQILELADRF